MTCNRSSPWQQTWRLFAGPAGLDGGAKEVEHGAFLQTQRLHRGDQTLDETATVFAVAAETTFAPQHCQPQDAFTLVVGRIVPLDPAQGPQLRCDTNPT